MTKEQAIEYWYRALGEEFGLVVTFRDQPDAEAARTMLYTARREADDPQLKELAIVHPGDAPNEILIVKRSVELED